MAKDIIRRGKAERAKHIGQRVKLFRECKELPIKLFAERCGISVSDMCDIESGSYRANTVELLKISEVLEVTYADLFETDDDKYYTNIDSPEIISCVLQVAKRVGASLTYICKILDIPKTTYHNWSEKKRISSPFDFMNILSLLKIDSDVLKSALAQRSVPAEETAGKAVEETVKETAQETVPDESDERESVMAEVIRACNMYKNIETMRADLDKIIKTAQELRAMLGGE